MVMFLEINLDPMNMFLTINIDPMIMFLTINLRSNGNFLANNLDPIVILVLMWQQAKWRVISIPLPQHGDF